MESDIDFVITWVDGSDPKWLKDRAKFLGEKNIDEARYRDWGLLKYWFRAIEQNAPWVRKIHFVTYGHYPEWLNTKNPKLHIVKHEDFIDKKFLPTFNSCAIEMNLNKIPGLAEKFVYFNDDVFLNKLVKPKYFFKGDVPIDYAPFGVPGADDYMHYCICVNNVTVLNKYFSKKQIRKNYLLKYINPKYGLMNIKSIMALPWNKITGFDETHSFSPMLKTTIDKIWEFEKSRLEQTTASRTRNEKNVNQYLFKYWNFCRGNFVPKKKDIRVLNPLKDNHEADLAIREIMKPKAVSLCLNDTKGGKYDPKIIERITKALSDRYQQKSTFEK